MALLLRISLYSPLAAIGLIVSRPAKTAISPNLTNSSNLASLSNFTTSSSNFTNSSNHANLFNLTNSPSFTISSSYNFAPLYQFERRTADDNDDADGGRRTTGEDSRQRRTTTSTSTRWRRTMAKTAKTARTTRKTRTTAAEWNIFAAIDRNFIDVFDCWTKLFLASGSKMGLRVTTLDNDAREHVNSWEKDHSRSLQGRGPASFSHKALALDLIQMPATNEVHANKYGLNFSMSPPRYVVEFWRGLDAGLNASSGGVLHSDMDAFFMRNPDPLLNMVLRQYPDVDIVTQVAHFKPQETVKDWGFAINVGFTLFRKTDPVVKMVRELRARAEFYDDLVRNMSSRDDESARKELMDFYEQTVLNVYLQDRGCEWIANDKHAMVAHFGQCGDITVAIIGDPYVNNLMGAAYMSKAERVVFHPYLGFPSQDAKMKYLRGAGVC